MELISLSSHPPQMTSSPSNRPTVAAAPKVLLPKGAMLNILPDLRSTTSVESSLADPLNPDETSNLVPK